LHTLNGLAHLKRLRKRVRLRRGTLDGLRGRRHRISLVYLVVVGLLLLRSGRGATIAGASWSRPVMVLNLFVLVQRAFGAVSLATPAVEPPLYFISRPSVPLLVLLVAVIRHLTRSSCISVYFARVVVCGSLRRGRTLLLDNLLEGRRLLLDGGLGHRYLERLLIAFNCSLVLLRKFLNLCTRGDRDL